MFKRSISLILSCVLALSTLFSLSVTADAMDTANLTEVINAYSNQDIAYSISAQKPLKSLSSGEYEYTLYALSPYGYAILYDATGNLMEACYAEGAEAPIDVSSSEVYYYGGPFVYESLGARWNHTVVVYLTSFHPSDPAYTATSNRHTKACANCNHVINEIHSFGEWNRTIVRHSRACSVCGYKQMGVHTYVDMITGWFCSDCLYPQPN